MTYGYFDDTAREYIITNPKTPTKWINYVGTLAFGGLVDHTGGALICRQDPALNRITKYIPQIPSADFKGSTLYLRYKSGDGYTVFSPYYVPTLDPYDRFECHVGLGYSRFVTEFYGIRSEITVFVPPGDTRVIWNMTFTNLTDQPITLDAIPVVEYTHFDALKQYTNADWVPQTMQSQAVTVDDQTILLQYAFMMRDIQINYFAANLPITSFETDRKRFLGDNEYGTWANPLSLQQPKLSNHEALRGDNVGALMIPLGELAPGASQRLIAQLGQSPSLENAIPGIRKFWDTAAVDATFDKLAQFWADYLTALQIDTPDASLNTMLNVHNPRQCHTTKNWSRYLSLYQLGLGARGIGFRDSSQDVLGVLAHMPDEAKALIVQLLSVQKRNGSAMHQFFPLTMEANEGDSREREDRPHYYSDDHLWIILAVCGYLRETGDYAFLDQEIPFYDKGKSDQPLESGTVREHLRRGIEFTHSETGTHGLPLAGFADWNDPTNLRTGAESLFTANLYGRALRELIDLAAYENDVATRDHFTAYYDTMRETVNAHAWDGAWYVRYFDFDGTPIGSHQNPTGQIYTNAQSWAIFSGFAPQDRAESALQAVNERLNTAKGIKLSTPGFDGYDPNIGGISTFPPGAKENGGIFLHANPWVIIAETIMGNGDRAYQYYRQINPAAKNDIIDEYEIEPYVYAQNILGDEHPQFGLGRNSWLSGTASWMYQAGTQWILGIQPTHTGLSVNPCIPQAWDGFTATRKFRGATYQITVTNPDHVSKGVKSFSVDDRVIDGHIVPIFTEGQHTIEVVLG
ncbi:MAG: glycosyl transferase [Anaerolineae bacterium]|nr:glycosyl transferase [Anaerolineae bacterium]